MGIRIDAVALPTDTSIFQAGQAAMRERTINSDWRRALPVLQGTGFHLREVQHSDAASLLLTLTTEEVARFITPPPASVDGFERFIHYAQQQRSQGTFACFAVVPDGLDTAIGVFQVRALDGVFSTAEWGFALGVPFWGTGLFVKAASLVLSFAFETVGINRLEARAMVANGRGNAALRKVGAQREALLRQAMAKDGHLHDQYLWTIVETDWRQSKNSGQPVNGQNPPPKPHLTRSMDWWDRMTGGRVH